MGNPMKAKDYDTRYNDDWMHSPGRIDSPHGLVRRMWRHYDGGWEWHIDNENVEFFFRTTVKPWTHGDDWKTLTRIASEEHKAFIEGYG